MEGSAVRLLTPLPNATQTQHSEHNKRDSQYSRRAVTHLRQRAARDGLVERPLRATPSIGEAGEQGQRSHPHEGATRGVRVKLRPLLSRATTQAHNPLFCPQWDEENLEENEKIKVGQLLCACMHRESTAA